MRPMRSRLSWLRPLNAHWFVLCLWLTLLGNAHAASAMTGRYWIDPTGQAPVSEVAALPEAALRPLEQRSFRLGPAALWLRIELPARPAGAEQYLVLDSSAFTDRASLFQHAPSGNWQGQHAGDHLPVAQWPIPDRSPVFALGADTSARTVWLRLQNHPAPLSVNVSC